MGAPTDTPPGFLLTDQGSIYLATPRITFYIDGSWDAKSKRRVGAWAAACASEVVRHVQARQIFAASALQTEVYACHLALAWAIANGKHNALVLTDSAMLIHLLHSKTTKDISVLHLIREIKEMGGALGWCRILKVSRQEVSLAHELATSCRTSGINVYCL